MSHTGSMQVGGIICHWT